MKAGNLLGLLAAFAVVSCSPSEVSDNSSTTESPPSQTDVTDEGPVLASGDSLESGQALVASNGLSELAVLASGDVVLSYLPANQSDPRRSAMDSPVEVNSSCDDWECLINQPRELWSTGTDGHPGATLTMQTDGDLQVLDGTKVLWSSSTAGAPGAELVLGDDGAAEIVDPAGTSTTAEDAAPAATDGTSSVRSAVATAADLGYARTGVEVVAATQATDTPPPHFSTNTAAPSFQGATLGSGVTLKPNEYLQPSNGEYELGMAANGALTLFTMSGIPCPMWVQPGLIETAEAAAESAGKTPPVVYGVPTALSAGSYLTMQTDGNLVLYTTSGDVQWASNTSGNSGATAALQNDGNFVVYSSSGAVLWASNTDNTPGTVLCHGDTMSQFQQMSSVGDEDGLSYKMQFATDAGSGSELDTFRVDGPADTYQIWHDLSAPLSVFLTMQDDGNLVIYPGSPGGSEAAGTSLWATGTNGNGDTYAELVQQTLTVWQVTVVNGAPTQTSLWSGGPKAEKPRGEGSTGSKFADALEMMLEVIA